MKFGNYLLNDDDCDSDSQAMYLATAVLFLCTPHYVIGGCRWYNPVWLETLSAAPQVDISPDNLVTVGWGKKQFKEGFHCVDKFEAWVEGPGEERRLCSIARRTG